MVKQSIEKEDENFPGKEEVIAIVKEEMFNHPDSCDEAVKASKKRARRLKDYPERLLDFYEERAIRRILWGLRHTQNMKIK